MDSPFLLMNCSLRATTNDFSPSSGDSLVESSTESMRKPTEVLDVDDTFVFELVAAPSACQLYSYFENEFQTLA